MTSRVTITSPYQGRDANDIDRPLPLIGEARHATIPREDVAAFMLREMESARFSARTPMITAR